MNNYNFPPFNDLSNNIYPIPDLKNINSIPIQQNQLNLPLNINQIIPNNQNQILPLLFPDQFLCQNQLYLLPRLLVVPQPNQMDYINQLIMEQNLRNSNNIMNINNINNIYNNLLNIQQLNNLNENILNNILNKSNEQNKEKEKTEISNTQQGKKFFITHEETNVEKLNKMKNDINTFNEKLTPENNNIYLPQLKNTQIINTINNNQNLNLKLEENNYPKSKFSLFTTSSQPNINSNLTSEVNTLLNKSKPKFQLQNVNQSKSSQENNTELNPNLARPNPETNKCLFNLQHLEEKQEKEKVKYYRCSFKECNKVFLKQSNLKDHIRTHTGEKPYICLHPGCGKTFSQHGNLKKHEKIHSGNKKYYCTYPNCGKKFSASYNLKIHYRCHTGEKPYKCNFPNCGRKFYDKGNLKYHEKNMHALENMEYPYSCEHMGCNAKFKTKLEKLKHHNEMEVDCYKERKELIKLIQRYKIFFKKIIIKKGIDADKNEIVLKLKKNYEEIKDKLIDKELFDHYLGDKFENDCTNVEEIKENNEEKNEENILKAKEDININIEKEEEINDIDNDNNDDEIKEKIEDNENDNENEDNNENDNDEIVD
jgi:uncharacterized Zn-finger protein